MAKMLFDLTDDDREALEAIRRNRGHRSQAETLRELIRQAASSGIPAPERQVEIIKQVLGRRGETVADAGFSLPADRSRLIGDTLKIRLPPKPWSGGHPKPGQKRPKGK